METETNTETILKTPEEHEIKTAYFSFMSKFGKSYATLDHMEERYSVFKDNYLKIESHNNFLDADRKPAPFKMGVNSFSDMTEEEFVSQRLSNKLKMGPHTAGKTAAVERKLKSEE